MRMIKKAVIPAAGLGSRLRPLTYGVPKELLIIKNKPLIHYSVSECLSAGVKNIAVIINKKKEGIREYLENVFIKKIDFYFIYQNKAMGIADAILLAEDFINDEPFYILFPDIIFESDKNPLIDLQKCYIRNGSPCVGLISTAHYKFQIENLYGFIEYDRIDNAIVKIKKLLDKGSKNEGSYKMTGRGIWDNHLLTYLKNSKNINNIPHLSEVPALQKYINEHNFYGIILSYKGYDCGTFEGFKNAEENYKPLVNINKNKHIIISVVVPIYNEEKNILELYDRLTNALDSYKKRYEKIGKDLSYELIMVNDGSADRSWKIIKELNKSDKRVKGISFSRNFGQHPATLAGFAATVGDVIVLVDGDLQNPPEEIPRLLRKIDEGYDIAYGVRTSRKDKSWRKFGSKLVAKLMIKLLGGIKIPDAVSSFRAMNRKVLDNFLKIKEQNYYPAALMAWMGFRSAIVEVKHDRRRFGESKYKLGRLIFMTIDMVIGFTYRPLKLASALGIAFASFSFALGIYMIVRKIFFSISVPGYASLMVAITFFSGLNLLFLGVIGEYIARIYRESKGRPYYIIEEKLE